MFRREGKLTEKKMARTKQTARQGAAGEGSKEASKEAVPPTPPGKVSGASGVQTPIGATAPATPSGSVGSTGGKKGGASLADFEATPVSTASKMKKRKKKADPTKVSNMEDLLQESNESVKEMGESLQKIGQLEEEEVTEAVPLKELQKKTPARKQQASKTIGPHHSFLKDRQTFPLNQLQTTLGAQILPNNSNMLDFTGCSQVTDAVLACMRDLPFNVRDSVTGLNLTGCHFITDAGVIAVADIFHNLKKLFLSGCYKVTEASMVEIVEKCPYLENLYIAGTSVSILPRKLSELDVVFDCTPLVSPLSSEAGIFPKASATMTKVCVIRREEETTMSVLSLLQGEKDVVATSPVNFKPNFCLSKDTLVNVTECNQSTVGLFVHGWGVYVIPSELTDKTKIEDEAKAILSIICSVLFKTGGGSFVLLGMHTSKAGIVPTDIVKEKVVDLAKDMVLKAGLKQTSAADPASLGEQQEYDALERMKLYLKDVNVTSLEVNVDDGAKATSKVKEHLEAQCAKNPESKILCKGLGDFMQGFPDQGGKDLKIGIHTLGGATELILKGTAFQTPLEAQGAVLYLAKVGKLSCYRQSSGKDVYISTPFLCQLICSMLDGAPKEENQTKDIAISDKTKVMTVQELTERAGKVKVTIDFLTQVLRETEVLGLHGRSEKTFFLYSSLPKEPSFSLDRFSKTADSILATHMFVLAFPVPAHLWYKAMARLTALHWPLHLWRHGMVMQQGVTETLITCNGNKITLLCKAVKVEGAGEEKCVTVLWDSVEQFKVLLDQVFCQSGLAPQVVCDADKPKPEGLSCIVDGHALDKQTGGCSVCGETLQIMALLSSAKSVVNPQVMWKNDIHFSQTNIPGTGGSLDGSNATLQAGGQAIVDVGFDGVIKQKCTILFNSMGFEGLSLQLSAYSKKAKVMFGDKETISLTRRGAQKGPSDVSKAVAGVALNITLQPLESGDLDCVVDCCGQTLSQQTLPKDRYAIILSQARESTMDVQFTVISQSFEKGGGQGLKKGMRLEALDRKTPSLVCVATITDIKPERKGKGGPLLIHFDGWTSSYDYWAEEDSEDLHPLGYMDEVGHKVPRKNPKLQAPHGYGKAFEWTIYLQEMNAEPVPFGFFSEKQTKGTKPNKTLAVCSVLGLHSLQAASSSKYQCNSIPYRNSALEHWVKQEMAGGTDHKPLQLATFLKVNSRFFCLLPSGLDLQFLRYPSMTTLFQADAQSLHMLCCGQENRHHLVDDEGIRFSEVAKTYQGLAAYLQCAYLFLMQTGAFTIPFNMKNLCKGIPADQSDRAELGFQRLYKLYAILFHFVDTAGAVGTKELDENKSSSMTLDTEIAMQLKKVLEEKAAQKESGFSDLFSHSAEFTKLHCKAHVAAESGDKGLTVFPPAIFDIGKTGTLVNLYLFRNNLESLPADLSESCPSLRQLMVSSNKLTAMPSLAGFNCLTHLYMAKNKIKSLEFSDNLADTLVVVDISDNPLSALPRSLSKLNRLTALVADNIGAVGSLEPLLGLKNLEKVSLNYNFISALPANFHQCGFTSLALAAIPLAKSRSSGVEHVTMESLMKTYEQYTAVSVLPEKDRATLFLMVQGKPLEENIAAINSRLLKRFPRIEGNKFPEQLLKMTKLQRLDLSNQGFVSVPDEIKNLTKLNNLTLTGCHNLETLSPQVSNLPLEVLALNECPSLKTPPQEIVERGFQAVFGYLRRLQMGSVDCKRTKLMFVGLGGAGKTSLVQSLRTGSFSMQESFNEQITDGIDICEWNVPLQNEKTPLQYSVWDFAGQTVYYNTHQFFMSNRAVYMLLWNIRLGYEHAGLDFWLSSIACHAPKAPVLVVGTHCDKVSKSHIPEAELKRRFPQIHSFYFVSSYTGEGLEKLRNDLVSVTLIQKYMGEKIPEVWLNLEKQLIGIRDKEKKALLAWKEMEAAGYKSGIFDNTELTQAVQFLHDLGSVQFFNAEFLRSKVVIIPQWIVDVMACVVTVHTGPIKNGKVLHEDLGDVWKAYPKDLHPWLLRLTEEFDLTFSLPEEKANIIPCLLPDVAPEYKWPTVTRDSGEREMKMIYKFDYLPTGLFNRAQVRLHEFSESAIMWKKGSLLKKNQHSALVLQTGNVEVLVKAQGFKPENMLFLVHEVIECLIAESYSGVQYDYLIPCMECQTQLQSEPCMFPRSKVQRAVEFKAPFLQCDTFHIMSIPEIQAIMPPDHKSDFDDHLRRGVHELHSLEEDVVISVFVCYSRKNVPGLADDGKIVHPATVLEDLRAAGYKVSFTDDPENASMEALTLSMKSAQVVIIGISDDFLASKQCYSLIFYARETLKKPFLLMTLGKTSNWQKQDINFLLGNEVYVKMQDISRYGPKIKELVGAVKTKAGTKNTEIFPDCFISYCWKNSKKAVTLGTTSTPQALGWGDPRKAKQFLQDKGVTCWLDVEQMGQEGFYEDLARGVRTSKVMVAFVSDEYAMSKTCRMEFQFAVESVRIPVIVAVVGTGFQWERSEIGMLAVGHNCYKVSLQLENKNGLTQIATKVNEILSKVKGSNSAAPAPLSSGDQRKIAFQEAMELTQRKFVRQLAMYMTSTGHEEYPHLIVVDIFDKSKGQGQQDNSRKLESAATNETEAKEGAGDKKGEEQEKAEATAVQSEQQTTSDQYCVKALCEWEQGWHEVADWLSFPGEKGSEESFLKEVAPYCVRMMAILKHTSLPLPILTLPEGEQICKNFEEWSSHSSSEFEPAYKRLIDAVHNQDKNKTFCGLKRCHVTNGKQLWLCPEHAAKVGSVAADTVSSAHTGVTYVNPDDEDDDEDYDFQREEEEEEEAVKDPTPPPPQTPHTSRDQRSSKLTNRSTSRACLLM